jgi:hypothetical protein
MSKPISPLGQRMIDDMKLRNMSSATQGAYVRAVKHLSVFFGRSPTSSPSKTCGLSAAPGIAWASGGNHHPDRIQHVLLARRLAVPDAGVRDDPGSAEQRKERCTASGERGNSREIAGDAVPQQLRCRHDQQGVDDPVHLALVQSSLQPPAEPYAGGNGG